MSFSEFLNHESVTSFQSKGQSKNSQDTSSFGKKKLESPGVPLSPIEKEHLDLKSLALSKDKKTNQRESALSSRDNEETCDTPKVTLIYSVEKAEYETPITIRVLRMDKDMRSQMILYT